MEWRANRTEKTASEMKHGPGMDIGLINFIHKMSISWIYNLSISSWQGFYFFEKLWRGVNRAPHFIAAWYDVMVTLDAGRGIDWSGTTTTLKRELPGWIRADEPQPNFQRPPLNSLVFDHHLL